MFALIPGPLASSVVASGAAAHHAPSSGNPLLLGGYASSIVPAAVDSADSVRTYFDRHGELVTRSAACNHNAWTAAAHVPAANTRATVTRALASGLKNVCTSIHATWSAGLTAPAALHLYLNLRDGGSGLGTVLLSWVFGLPATAGATVGISLTDLWVVGTAGTAMTLEWSAAGGANTYQVVAMTGTAIVE